MQSSNSEQLKFTAAALEGIERAKDLDFRALRARFVDACMADGSGGDSSAAVKHWIRFTIYARRISPERPGGSGMSQAAKMVEEALLMDFAIWLVLGKPLGNTISARTAAAYVGTVRAWHERRFGAKIGADLEMTRLRDMVKGLRRSISQPPKRKRYGIRTQDLRTALALYLSPSPADNAAEKLDKLNWRALLTVAFAALMRGGEVALQAKQAFDADLHLTFADVSFSFEDGARVATVLMRPSKNGRHLRGKSVQIVLHDGELLQPVTELWNLCQAEAIPDGLKSSSPLFRKRGSGEPRPFLVSEVRSMIRFLMGLLGLDGKLFGAHSLRIGGATAALAGRAAPEVIRLAGRWNSDLWEIYSRVSSEAVGAVSKLVCSTAFHDLERGFHAEELEMLPEEMDVISDDD